MTATLRLSLATLLLASVVGSTARAQTAAPPAADAPPLAPPPGYPPPGYPPPGYPPPGYPPPGYPPPPGYGAPAYPAPPPAHAPGFQLHDGVYTRLTLGGGYTRMSASASGSDIVVSGGSVGLGVAVGGAITEHLVIYGAFAFTTIGSPTVSVDGMSSDNGGVSADSVGFGAGVAYYLEPANVYLAGTLLANEIEIDDSNGNTLGKTKLGVGVEALIGKEWWVSDNWGLGVAGQFLWASMKDNDDGGLTGGVTPTWTSTSFSVLFSATYN
jgi:hypothetical protein